MTSHRHPIGSGPRLLGALDKLIEIADEPLLIPARDPVEEDIEIDDEDDTEEQQWWEEYGSLQTDRQMAADYHHDEEANEQDEEDAQ